MTRHVPSANTSANSAASVPSAASVTRVIRDGEIVTAGGRVLNVTGLGPTAANARRRAYDAAELISFEGMQLRTDIAARAVDGEAAAA